MAWLAKGAKGKYGDTKAAGVESDPDRKLTGTWSVDSFPFGGGWRF